jgi:hypothetical protein
MAYVIFVGISIVGGNQFETATNAALIFAVMRTPPYRICRQGAFQRITGNENKGPGAGSPFVAGR